MSQAGKPTGVILGYNVLRLVDPKTVWSAFYQTRIADSKMPVLLAQAEDDVQAIVKSIMNHGWGYAIIVDRGGAPTNLIGLLDLAEFLVKSAFIGPGHERKGVGQGVQPDDLGEQRARHRGHHPDDARQAHEEALPERLCARRLRPRMIKWLLSPANLKRLRDSPKELLESSVASLGALLHKPLFVDPDIDAATALTWLNKEDGRCLITEDRKTILTPWDLTVSLLTK